MSGCTLNRNGAGVKLIQLFILVILDSWWQRLSTLHPSMIEVLFNMSEALSVIGIGVTSGVAVWLAVVAVMVVVCWMVDAVKAFKDKHE